MNPPTGALSGYADAWAGTVWAVTWQSAFVIAIVTLAAHGLRRASPAVRYWVWQVAAIKLLLMPLVTFSIILPAKPRPADDTAALLSKAEQGDVRSLELPAVPRGDFRKEASASADPPGSRASKLGAMTLGWRGWLFVGWVTAVGMQIAVIVRQGSRLKRMLRTARPPDDPHLNNLVAELSHRIGLRRPPEILIVDREGSPFVCGLGHPKLVLTAALVHGLDDESLQSVLLHELAHIKRGDLLWDWIPAGVRVVYFFNPLAHFLFDRIRLERELACDRAAMLLAGQEAKGYAATLIGVVGRTSAPPFLRAALGSAGLDGTAPIVPMAIHLSTIPGKE